MAPCSARLCWLTQPLLLNPWEEAPLAPCAKRMALAAVLAQSAGIVGLPEKSLHLVGDGSDTIKCRKSKTCLQTAPGLSKTNICSICGAGLRHHAGHHQRAVGAHIHTAVHPQPAPPGDTHPLCPCPCRRLVQASVQKVPPFLRLCPGLLHATLRARARAAAAKPTWPSPPKRS